MHHSSLPSSPFQYQSAFTYSSHHDTQKKYKSFSNFRSGFSYTYQLVPSVCPDEQRDCHEEETRCAKTLRILIIYICYIFLLILFPFSVWICIKRVHALERLVVLRLGKLQPVLGPGYCIVIPFIDQWTRVDLQPKTLTISTQQLLTADRAVVEAVATVKYCVCRAVNYVIRLHSQDHPLKNLVQHCVANLVSEKEQSDIEKHREEISSAVKVELNNTVLHWGLEILTVSISSVKVLKEAESTHGAEAVINVLKAITSEWNVPVAVPSATALNQNDSRSNTDLNFPIPVAADYVQLNKSENWLHRINCQLEEAEKKNVLHGITATCALRVQGKQTTRTVYIVLNNGRASVFDESETSCKADVTVALMEDDMEDLINFKSSVTQAYIEGKIQVFGDWSHLKVFSEIFHFS